MENMGISSEGHAKNANYIKGLWKKFSSIDCRKRYKFHKSSAEFFIKELQERCHCCQIAPKMTQILSMALWKKKPILSIKCRKDTI